MKKCLRCNCPFDGVSTFCDRCQASLLVRSQQKEHASSVGSSPHLMNDHRGKQSPWPLYPPPVDVSLPQASFTPDLPCLVAEDRLKVDAGHIVQTQYAGGSDDGVKEKRNPLLRIPPFAQPYLAGVRSSTRVRRIFLLIAILALVGVLVDGVLVLMTVARLHSRTEEADAAPLILLSRSFVNRGEEITIHLSHYEPLSQVILTRDVHEAIPLDSRTSLVLITSDGTASIQIPINSSWKPGSHQIEAEDIKTHFTSSTPLYVIGPDPVLPPHLQLSQTVLDMGSAVQWKNTSKVVTMSNTGGGAISWAASSNQPWLTIAPAQGNFSNAQNVSIAVTRAHLSPGSYNGVITIVSNTTGSLTIQVKMTVLPLPNGAGGILGVASAALSFTTTDGGGNPSEQTVLLSNPGSQMLSWTVTQNVSTNSTDQTMPPLTDNQWLKVQQTSGVIAPGATSVLHITVRSESLLQGQYTALLTFTTTHNTLTSPQILPVALSIGPHCGVIPSTRNMSFTVVAGQESQGSQNLDLGITPDCSGFMPWKAVASSNWLALTPVSGLVQEGKPSVTRVTVNGKDLQSSTYSGFIVFLTAQRADIVLVQLTVQNVGSAQRPDSQSLPGASGLQVFPSSLTFTATQGQTNPSEQSVALSSQEGSFYWHASVDDQAASWLNVVPLSGMVPAGQTSGQLMVNVNLMGIVPGIYQAHIVVNLTDSTGMPIDGSVSIPVTLHLAPPCTLQVTPTSLFFSSSLLGPSTSMQTLTVTTSGGCAYPVSWKALVDEESSNWLSVSPGNGSDNGAGGTITVMADARGILLGHYRGVITMIAYDSNGMATQNSAQTIVVTLSVLG